MGSRLYNIRRGKKTRLGRSVDSPRRRANSLRVGVGSGDRGAFRNATSAEAKKWKPKRGRKKLGARRKLTILETVFRWIKVPTGKVRKSKGRSR